MLLFEIMIIIDYDENLFENIDILLNIFLFNVISVNYLIIILFIFM